ncbi:hypothetical protein M408DRAFT_16414 [Serendipita vermifera MAFF 305830]|uniref:Nuclear condensin complex subunit 3 C-terminal domain-containing protein n=1 Tax=Serendipita vermifera MAFF 305830 TaxID=933852 RepID=A0A0C3B728_SERVB|nr:hypothetical protein M408DRAFT_16414 [Serendipita vermifera MAFF 305830]
MPSHAKQTAEEFLSSLHDTLAAIFQGAQTSNASHKRRVNNLCKLHQEAASYTQRKQRGRGQEDSIVLIGEKAFNRAFWDITMCIMDVKKGVIEADRTVRFIGTFIAALMGTPDDENAQDEDDEEETPKERFLSKLVAHVLPGCRAKDKTPRFRCSQLLSEILRNVPSLDDELYASISEVLLERGTDREWTIRSAASIGLGVLARGEAAQDPDSDDDSDEEKDRPRIASVLQALCQYDLHPHVRVSCLPGLAMPLNASTLPLLLSRTRDSDTGVRKMAFRLLQQVPVRGFSVAQRSLLVKNGLGDREAAVRAESSKLIYQWAVSCSDYTGGEPATSNVRQGRAQKQESKIDLDEFLDLFDLWDGEVAEEALKALVYKRPNILDGLDMSQAEFWSDFSPSKALLARVYTELVTASAPSMNPYGGNVSNFIGNTTYSFGPNSTMNMSSSVQGSTAMIPLDLSKSIDLLPVLTLQAFNIQGLFNILVQSVATVETLGQELPDVPGTSKEDMEDQVEDCIYSLGEMLKMTRSLVQGMEGDEMGKRKIKALAGDLLVHPYFPSTLLSSTLALLLKVADNNVDFTNIVIKPILDDVTREERRKDRTISRRYTLNAKKRARESTDDDQEVPEDAEDDLDDEEDEEEEEPSIDEQMRTAYLRLCILNEVLELIEWPQTQQESLRQLQKLLVRPALTVYATDTGVSATTKGMIFDSALKSLGLIAVHAETLALNALAFCIRGTLGAIPPGHSNKVLECISDIVMAHPKMTEMTFGDIVKEAPHELSGTPFLPVLLVKSLQAENTEVQATTALGICKLFLCGIWFNDEIMEALVLLYFLPDTAPNTSLRQCLSYFFPAFCYSSSTNQSRFSTIVTGAIIKLCPVYEELRGEAEANDEATALIQPERVISILLDYSDPGNLVEAAQPKEPGDTENNHVQLAIDMMEKIELLIKNGDDDPAHCSISPLCYGLNRLQIPARVTADCLRKLISMVSDILTNHTPDDKAAFKQLTSFEAKLRKIKSKRKDSDSEGSVSENEITLKSAKTTKASGKRKRDSRSESDGGSNTHRIAKKRGSLSVQTQRTANEASDSEAGPKTHGTRPVKRKPNTNPETHDQEVLQSKRGKEKARYVISSFIENSYLHIHRLRSEVPHSTSGSGTDTGPRKRRRR